MLKSSVILLLLTNIFADKLYVIGIVTGVLVAENLIINKNLKTDIYKMRFMFVMYLSLAFVQLLYNSTGKVYLKIYNFYITELGIYNFFITFLRVLNLLLISWIVNAKHLINTKFTKYQSVVENVVELVPEAIVIIKKRMKIKSFFRYVLKRINEKNNSSM